MKIVFSVPGFDPKSNGLNVLHCLARDFHKIGAEVRIIPWPYTGGHKYEQPEEYKDLYSARFPIDDAIAFLPDAIPKDIADKIKSQTRHCAWWLCNVPGLLGHELQQFDDNDFIFAYSKLISAHLPQLYYHGEVIGLPPLEQIVKKRKEADLVLVYTGKGAIRPIPKSISGQLPDSSKIVYISRFFPENKESLYSLLMRAKFLISFDPISNLNYEATLLGVPVFLVNHLRLELNMQKDFNIPQHGIFRNPEEFIQMARVGLDLEVIHSCHKNALNTNINRVEESYNFLKSWAENSSDSFASKFQAHIAPLYHKVVGYELPRLRTTIDPNVGSARTLPPKQAAYLKRCIETPGNTKISMYCRLRNGLYKKLNNFFHLKIHINY